MSSLDAVNFLMISRTLGFDNRQVQQLLYECLSIHVSDSQILSIYRSNEHKYVNYKKDLQTGKKRLPRRISRFAKKHSINIDISGNTQSSANYPVLSLALSLVLRRSSISCEEVCSALRQEFPMMSQNEVSEIVNSLVIDGYSFKEGNFVRNATSFAKESQNLTFIDGYGDVSVLPGSRSYFDKRNRHLYIKNGVLPEHFLMMLFDRQDQYYSEELHRILNKIDSIL